MSKPRIMIVEDDAAVREAMGAVLSTEGFDVQAADTGEAAMDLLDDSFDVVLADIFLPGMDGIELLRRVRIRNDGLDVLMMTSHSSVDSAVEAMRLGATDYIAKPIDPRALRVRVERVLERRRLAAEVARLRQEIEGRYQFGNLLGHNGKMQQVYEMIAAISDTDATVLIQGETGTGKELAAKAIHYNSERKKRPFVKVDCAALTETLLESELFGHARGAFTGATRDREGRFRTAEGGTIFLDEIGNVPPSIQVKLLRVLQDSEFEPVGDDRTVRVDTRVLCATNVDLARLVQAEAFRRDLYYRVNVVKVWLPPLRERKDDIPLLAEHFLRRYCERNRRAIRGFSPAALDRLSSHDWPGNVRELENAVERAVLLSKSDVLDAGDLPLGDDTPFGEPAEPRPQTLKESLEAAERRAISEALARCGGDKEEAARQLGISRASLYSKIKKLGVPPPL